MGGGVRVKSSPHQIDFWLGTPLRLRNEDINKKCQSEEFSLRELCFLTCTKATSTLAKARFLFSNRFLVYVLEIIKRDFYNISITYN